MPEDRLKTGVSKSCTISENLILNRYYTPPYSKRGVFSHAKISRFSEELCKSFLVKTPDATYPLSTLSGGNMQKVVVAREFSHETPVLVISNPSRGIDIGAIEFIHTAIIDKRNEGCAILLSSADLDEIFRLSDRIVTMYEGRITGEFRADEITKEEIGYYMTGSRRKEAEQAHEAAN